MLQLWMSVVPTHGAGGSIRCSLACALLLTFSLVAIFSVSHSDPLSTQPPLSSSPGAAPGEDPAPTQLRVRAALALPPPPAGVIDLTFKEFFVLPVGPRGLTVTEKLQSLDRKRVRILGYMARQGEPHPGFFLLTPRPIQLHEHEYGHADDLPPTVVFVHLPQYKDTIVPYINGSLLLVGTLSVGNQEEKDGRISMVRLTLNTVPQAIVARIERATLESPAHPHHSHK